MLVNLKFKNFRSFYDENVLSMQATSNSEHKEINTFCVDEKLFNKNDNELLKSAIIFGGNASGKTNVIRALSYMVNMISLSASNIPITASNENFIFLNSSDREDSLYEVEIVANNKFYRYGFIINNKVITKEWLFKREERLTSVFDRDNNKLEINKLSKDTAKLINVPNNTLFLSIANIYNIDIVDDTNNVITWFRELLIVMENSVNSLDIYSMNNNKYKKKALEILKLADVGIDNINVVKDKVVNVNDFNDILSMNTQMQITPNKFAGQMKQEKELLYNIDLETVFKVYNKDLQEVGKKSIMLFKEGHFNSEGTHRLLCYMGWILAALDQGRVIVIDELDSKLHYLVVDFILKLFNSIVNNPKNAQLLCTVHSTSLMDEDFRRDQIYFTSKDKYGKSQLVSLADFNNVRKNDLFSKKYLAGFYSDLPNMKKQ